MYAEFFVIMNFLASVFSINLW